MYAIIEAARRGSLKAVKSLISSGIDPNVQNTRGNTALRAATSKHATNVVQFLLRSGADPNMQTELDTPLDIAIYRGYTDIVMDLVNVGTNVPSNILLQASTMNPDIIKFLSTIVSVDAKDVLGRTPLMYASFSGKLNIVEILVYAGANVNARDIRGNTALMFAAEHRHTNVIEFLLSNGAEPNIQGENGETALMRAYPNLHTLEVLLKGGADPDFQDDRGDTALIIAAEYKNENAIMLLLKNGADLTITNNQGLGAYDYVDDTMKEKMFPYSDSYHRVMENAVSVTKY